MGRRRAALALALRLPSLGLQPAPGCSLAGTCRFARARDCQRRAEPAAEPLQRQLPIASLAARVLRDGLTDKTAIKKLVTRWEGDYLRA